MCVFQNFFHVSEYRKFQHKTKSNRFLFILDPNFAQRSQLCESLQDKQLGTDSNNETVDFSQLQRNHEQKRSFADLHWERTTVHELENRR